MIALVVTSISEPTPGLRDLAASAEESGWDFIVVGDETGPASFDVASCDFYGLERQRSLDFEYARLCPVRTYARKNVGYLVAMQRGAEVIVETDDDTVAYPSFWLERARAAPARTVGRQGWVNVYRYFTDALIWPRGLPLDEVKLQLAQPDLLPVDTADCPIQQALVDADPDVDAVYRLLLELPFHFDERPSVVLDAGAWCPFNSQNTSWWPDAFPLLYLPASCSFRMTDIWRSFVAQRIAWTNGWRVLFQPPSVQQDRNPHDLMRDFGEENVGYLGNRAICETLASLELQPGVEHVPANMRVAYEALVEHGWLDARELDLLDAWLADVAVASADARKRIADQHVDDARAAEGGLG